MAANRLILLLAIIVILTILLLQNWSPVLSLAFLGIKTKPLPLAIWIILSLFAGAATSWLISNLYQLSRYFSNQKQPTRPRNNYKRPSVKESTQKEVKFNTNKTTKQPEPATQVIEDDWDTDNVAGEDWNFEESADKQRVQDSANRQDYGEYERSPQRDRDDRDDKSDSAYSYSYREPKNTGVGKTESVYDADYRVIIPPYQPPEKSPPIGDDEDEWSFFEDEEDDFDDDVSQPPPKRDR
jgi:uncharacterized integral membrane protein